MRFMIIKLSKYTYINAEFFKLKKFLLNSMIYQLKVKY